MSATKEKILETALLLFNRDGIDAVTIRHIAQEMGISHGNLQYHYASTDVIIHELYNRMAARFDVLMTAAPEQLMDELLQFRETVAETYRLIHGYRFIFLHFVEIGRRVPAIIKHYHQNMKKREPQMLHLFQLLKEKGVMRKDIPEDILKLLVQQIFLVSDFWLSSNEITMQLRGKKALEYHERFFFSMLYPYLTPKGLKYFL